MWIGLDVHYLKGFTFQKRRTGRGTRARQKQDYRGSAEIISGVSP